MNDQERIDTLEVIVAGLLSEVCVLKAKEQKKQEAKDAEQRAWQTMGNTTATVNPGNFTTIASTQFNPLHNQLQGLSNQSASTYQGSVQQFSDLYRGNAATQPPASQQNTSVMAALRRKMGEKW